MVSCLKYDPMLDSGYFYSDTIAELAHLPNMVENGKFELSNMNSVTAGSRCIVQENKKVYILTGNNEWDIYRSAPGGGGGGGDDEGADWPDGYETEDIDFDDWGDNNNSGSGSNNSSNNDEEENEDLDFSGF